MFAWLRLYLVCVPVGWRRSERPLPRSTPWRRPWRRWSWSGATCASSSYRTGKRSVPSIYRIAYLHFVNISYVINKEWSALKGVNYCIIWLAYCQCFHDLFLLQENCILSHVTWQDDTVGEIVLLFSRLFVSLSMLSFLFQVNCLFLLINIWN